MGLGAGLAARPPSLPHPCPPPVTLAHLGKRILRAHPQNLSTSLRVQNRSSPILYTPTPVSRSGNILEMELELPNRNGVRSDQSGPTPTHDHVTLTVGEPLQSPVLPASVQRTEGLAEHEIRSLLWMEQKGNELLARAYVEWEKRDMLFASRIDKKKKQSNSLRNEIYQLIGFYSVFQGVLLTAVAQSNLLHCNNWWCAFFLSLFASLVTIAGVVQKFLAVLALEKTIQNEAGTRQECINRASRLRQKRGDFNFDRDAAEPKRREFDQRRLKRYIVLVAGTLVVFSSLFLISIYRVLCYFGESPPPT